MIQVKDTNKHLTRQDIGGFGALVPDVSRDIAEARPAKPVADVALIAGFAVTLTAIFWSALHATDGESLFWLIVLFGAVAAMFPADAVWRLVE